ncbi:MAG: BREX system P-loop protein BrxC, partial [Planctomycetaceae bacterium]
MRIIRDLFSNTRPIDRPIEKVIDYYATDSKRLAREIEEYEVTDNIEACFQRFLDVFGQGVRTGDITEIGIWVWGFYGCGKSSFTKYLGFALSPTFVVEGTAFFELLCNRLKSHQTQAELRALVNQHPTTVIMLDLGAEQLADTASASVTTVLYWKVLQWAGYSTEKKIAQLELKLEESRLYDEFQQAYRDVFSGKGEWTDIHNDPLIGISRADQLVPQFLPDDFSKRGDFRSLKFEQALTVRDQAEQMIRLIRRRSGHENILFLIDEAGQYVAPRSELILNLDGLARNLKELGDGRVWIAATGQQTLAEIVEKSAHNSTELNKLRDRFPISIGLDARDIREITYLRLLTKSAEGQQNLHDLFNRR